MGSAQSRFEEDDKILLYFGALMNLTPFLLGVTKDENSHPRIDYLKIHKKNRKVINVIKRVTHFVYIDMLLTNWSHVFTSKKHICNFIEIYVRWNFRDKNIDIDHNEDENVVTFTIEDRLKFTYFYEMDYKDYPGPRDIEALYVSGFDSNKLSKEWRELVVPNVVIANDYNDKDWVKKHEELLKFDNVIRDVVNYHLVLFYIMIIKNETFYNINSPFINRDGNGTLLSMMCFFRIYSSFMWL